MIHLPSLVASTSPIPYTGSRKNGTPFREIFLKKFQKVPKSAAIQHKIAVLIRRIIWEIFPILQDSSTDMPASWTTMTGGSVPPRALVCEL
jgi:hypothetical protein